MSRKCAEDDPNRDPPVSGGSRRPQTDGAVVVGETVIEPTPLTITVSASEQPVVVEAVTVDSSSLSALT